MSGYASNRPSSTSSRMGFANRTTPHGVRYSSRVKFTKPKVKPRDYVYVSRGASVARPSNRKLGHLPGYSGTIPHLDQVLGRSFGAASRHAFSHSPIQLFVEDSIPPSPHATNNVRVSESAYERRGGRMPGYTGYMPDSAHCYGTTFGATALKSHAYHSANTVQQRQTMNRESLRLASAPTPRKPSRFF